MEISFKNKTVLITGASRGIGRATTIAFAEAGASMIVHYRNNFSAAEKTLSMLAQGKHFAIAADLTDPVDVENFSKEVIKKTGHVDILVNNAGVYIEKNITEMNYTEFQENWARTINTNLTGIANLCFHISKHMIEKGGGKIINVSSRGAFRGEPNALAYGASKAGLNSFGQSLAKALAPYKVYVYTVAPGFVETEMAAEGLAGKGGDEIRNQSPLNRVAQPEEIANAILMLAAANNDYMTGCILDINGASYLRT
jgi:3-oxoacyl-[acyl-carrier protein] reductase